MNIHIDTVNIHLNADSVLEALKDKEFFELKEKLMRISNDIIAEKVKNNLAADTNIMKDISGSGGGRSGSKPVSKIKICPTCRISFTGANRQKYCSIECGMKPKPMSMKKNEPEPLSEEKKEEELLPLNSHTEIINPRLLKTGERICKNKACKKIFMPKKFGQKFCSDKCEKAHSMI
jgi:hypothetical protein